MEKTEIKFTAQQIILEFWISFVNNEGIETGVLVKKLSQEGQYLISTGICKRVFTLEEIEHPKCNGSLVHLPFTFGATDLSATDTMHHETFVSFLKSFKRAFRLPEPTPA